MSLDHLYLHDKFIFLSQLISRLWFVVFVSWWLIKTIKHSSATVTVADPEIPFYVWEIIDFVVIFQSLFVYFEQTY